MYNTTELLKQWNDHSGQQKVIAHFFENSATQEFIEAILLEENFTHRNSVYVKSKASRGDNAGTWMHPILFIDFAMWINPKFKVKVLKFLHDKLIKHRIDTGEKISTHKQLFQKIVNKSILFIVIQ